jgi:hypothetical protein
MKAADVTQHSLDVPKAALAAENPIFGTWKLQSLVVTGCHICIAKADLDYRLVLKARI